METAAAYHIKPGFLPVYWPVGQHLFPDEDVLIRRNVAQRESEIISLFIKFWVKTFTILFIWSLALRRYTEFR